MEKSLIHQKKAIEALELLNKICLKHGFTLYLLAGTALGAVRHKGMIPWDDDIDVGLKYEEWIKVRKILPLELHNKEFEYIDLDINPGFPRFFGKILYQGRSCIDIFLIAKWTYNKFLGSLHWQIRKTAVELYKISIGYKTPFRPTITKKEIKRYYFTHLVRYVLYCILCPFCKSDTYVALARWNEKYYENHKYDCYINLYSIYSMRKEMIKREWIEKTSEIEFEGNIYITVGDTNAYLKHLYGDYMTPPPVNQRVGSHDEEFRIGL